MSTFNRLERIVKSWVGKARRNVYYDFDDARAILNELGLQMSPEALAHMTSSDLIMQEFLDCVYAAEDVIGRDLIQHNKEINPLYEPKVYEEDGWIIFTITRRTKELVYGEFPMPGAKSRSQIEAEEAKEEVRAEAMETREIEIQVEEDDSPEPSPEPEKESEVRNIEIEFDED